MAALNVKPMNAALNGVLKPQMGEINMVPAPQIAKAIAALRWKWRRATSRAPMKAISA